VNEIMNLVGGIPFVILFPVASNEFLPYCFVLKSLIFQFFDRTSNFAISIYVSFYECVEHVSVISFGRLYLTCK